MRLHRKIQHHALLYRSGATYIGSPDRGSSSRLISDLPPSLGIFASPGRTIARRRAAVVCLVSPSRAGVWARQFRTVPLPQRSGAGGPRNEATRLCCIGRVPCSFATSTPLAGSKPASHVPPGKGGFRFPCGPNSPQSRVSRFWRTGRPQFVDNGLQKEESDLSLKTWATLMI